MRTQLKKLILWGGYTIFKIVRTPIKWYWKIFNIQTKGIRVLLVHEDSLVLVRHWYNNLWVMPGGGIKKHETPEQAAIREIQEETGIKSLQLDYLLGQYSNNKEGKNDMVYCYVVMLPNQLPLSTKFNLEIADSKWFSLHELPEGTSKATKSRIMEYLDQNISSEIRPWS